jgi:hypothetical protein
VNNNEEQPKTAEERELLIEQLKTEQAKYAADRAQDEAEKERLRESGRITNFAQTLKSEIGRSGIVFEGEQDELERLIPRTGCTLRSSADGRMIQALDEAGKEVPISKVMEKLAVKFPFMVKDGTADHLLPKRDSKGKFSGEASLSKQDFKTTASKSLAIKERGLSWWESLPLHPTLGSSNDVNKLGRSDWSKLNVTQRSGLIAQYGSEIVQEIISRP